MKKGMKQETFFEEAWGEERGQGVPFLKVDELGSAFLYASYFKRYKW